MTFLIYMIVINIISFVLNSLDVYLYLNKHKSVKPKYLLELLIILGGSLGSLISILLFNRKTNKRTLIRKILTIAMLIIHTIIIVIFFGTEGTYYRNQLNQYISDNIILIIYLILINIITYITYALDKYKAVKDQWRIKEITLLGLSLIGGSLGALIAMYTLRHKTKKLYFSISVPLMLILHLYLIFVFF